MAIVASVATGDVRRVFADRRNTVVAGSACADYLGVVDGEDRCEHIGCVAVLAYVGRLYVL